MFSYKFRVYPKKEQEERLLEVLELCRQTYNHFLEQWKGKDKIPSRFEIQSQLPKLKKERTELEKVHSKVLQMVLFQLYSNLKALSRLKKNGKKVGKLRFKSKGRYKTLVYNQSGFKLIKTGKRLDLLYLSKIGELPIKVHRSVEGKIKGVIIKRYNSGRWFACLCIEKETSLSKVIQKETRKVVGIDVGIKHFLSDSDGRQIENPRFYEKVLERIKVVQRWLSRSKKGSKNYENKRVKLAKLYEKLTNQRDDFLHKLSRFYIDNYDVICVENLKIKNMIKNHNLAQKILDTSWGKFLCFLSYKAESAGRMVVKVDPKGTSKNIPKEFDRDYIASRRILQVGLGRPEFTPVEMGPLLSVSVQAVIAGQVLLPKQEAPCES